MPLHDFYVERRSFIQGERRFTCRKPSLIFVHLLLGLYDTEILALLKCVKEGKVKLDENPVTAALPFFATGGYRRMHRLLQTCVTAEGGRLPDGLQEEDLFPQSVHRIVTTLCELTDVKRVIESCQLDDALAALESAKGEEDLPPDGDREQVWGVGVIARTFAMNPTEVLDLPYEAFLTAVEDLHSLFPQVKSPKASKTNSEPLSAEDLERLGFPVSR